MAASDNIALGLVMTISDKIAPDLVTTTSGDYEAYYAYFTLGPATSSIYTYPFPFRAASIPTF